MRSIDLCCPEVTRGRDERLPWSFLMTETTGYRPSLRRYIGQQVCDLVWLSALQPVCSNVLYLSELPHIASDRMRGISASRCRVD